MAEAADKPAVPDGVSLPDEIKRREDRLSAIATAKAKIEERAKKRYEQEQAEHETQRAARAKKQAQTGKKPSGKPPKPPEAGPRPDDQLNLTDEESPIMKVAGGGFEQCTNVQARVDTESMRVLVSHVSQATNNKQQVATMVEKVQANPEGLNQPHTLLADTGYFSEKNVQTCVQSQVIPLIAVKRDEYYPGWRDRFTEPEALAEGASSVDAMRHALKTRTGRAAYALRKKTVEPVFGIIKSVMGFRQFLLRGLESNCVSSQAVLAWKWCSSQGLFVFIMAFKMVSSLCMQATMATFLGFPLTSSRS